MEGTPKGQGAGCRFFADFLWTSKESQATCGGATPRHGGNSNLVIASLHPSHTDREQQPTSPATP
jgi:hypothetical protein